MIRRAARRARQAAEHVRTAAEYARFVWSKIQRRVMGIRRQDTPRDRGI